MCDVFSLSPSDQTTLDFYDEISTLITEYGGNNRKIVLKNPNSKSIVLYLKIGKHAVLLGADLELHKDDRYGWLNIIKYSTVIDKKASLFKIPHHGSENGYHQEIFTTLLVNKPLIKLTPWNKREKLPQTDMVEKYLSHSTSFFSTSNFDAVERKKKRSKEEQKWIEQFNKTLRVAPFEKGIIRNRIQMENDADDWTTELYGSALLVG